MYLNLSQVNNDIGFRLEAIDKTVYTYEGLCHYLSIEPGRLASEVINPNTVAWIRDSLGLTEEAEALSEIFACDIELFDKLAGILSLCPYLKAEAPFRDAYERYDAFVNKPQYVVWNNKGISFMLAGDFRKAEDAFNKGLQLEEHIEIRLNLIRLKALTDDYEAMLFALEEAASLYTDTRLWYYYGTAYEGLCQYEEALTAYLRSYETGYGEKALNRAVCLEARLGRSEQAFRRVTMSGLEAVRRVKLAAEIYLVIGDYDAYERQMETVIEQSPNDTKLLLAMAKHYTDIGQLIKAIGYIGRISDRDQQLEAVRVQKMAIASGAGNIRDFGGEVDSILGLWKREVRDMATG